MVGNLLDVLSKSPREFIEHACGLELAIRVWNECTERGTYKLKPEILEAIHEGLVDAMISADLAEWRGQLLRIKGTAGRTDWKAKATENGKLGGIHGKKGGRPRKTKTPSGVSEKPLVGLSEKPPLTPPTPTPIPPPTAPLLPLARTLPVGSEAAAAAWKNFWKEYPNKSREKIARAEFDNLPLTPDLVEVIMSGLARWKASVEWSKENGRYVPNPANWLRDHRFVEHPLQIAAATKSDSDPDEMLRNMRKVAGVECE